jgi:hypothetical protein
LEAFLSALNYELSLAGQRLESFLVLSRRDDKEDMGHSRYHFDREKNFDMSQDRSSSSKSVMLYIDEEKSQQQASETGSNQGRHRSSGIQFWNHIAQRLW